MYGPAGNQVVLFSLDQYALMGLAYPQYHVESKQASWPAQTDMSPAYGRLCQTFPVTVWSQYAPHSLLL